MAHILLINDEPDLLHMCRIVLESEGYAVDVTTAASRAVELAASGVDLVLLDLVMPRTTGDEVFRRLRESPRTREIPVVIMSALDDAKERAEAMGADGFIAKPFTPVTMLDAIHRAFAARTEGRLRSKPAEDRARRAH